MNKTYSTSNGTVTTTRVGADVEFVTRNDSGEVIASVTKPHDEAVRLMCALEMFGA